ncbi:GspMb/PilO family protein [Thermomonas carbonis]|uniref:General secretion pathway protein GspM n=1 Tax=Thermomonas carbonis TaxID=1463158 RepID=A0A7G9SU70_9GAMM|nr:GspMb/PilO family protein [Thermomonas carbonis]QNN71395.1 hypothetical protein H9L16_07590 [Thermomonas carbonis]
MTLAFMPKWLQLREEWRGNARLRMGVAIVAAILFVYACLLLWDWRSALHEEYRERTLQLYKMEALAGQQYWPARAQSARIVEKAVLAEIPDAATLGLAQAEVQTTVRQILNAFGPKMSSSTRPAAQVAGRPGIWRLPVALRGPANVMQLSEILRRIESAERLMTVEEMSITFARANPISR